MADPFVGTSPVIWGFENLKGASNWKNWEICFKNALKYERWIYVLTDEPDSSEEEDLESKWSIHNSRALSFIVAKCDSQPRSHVEECKRAKEAYEILKNQFASTGFTAKHNICCRLFTTTLSSLGGAIDTYITAFMNIKKELQALESGVPEWMFCSFMLNNLDKKYSDFVRSISLQKELPSFTIVAAQLREVERQFKKTNTETQAYRAQSGNNNKKGKNEKCSVCNFEDGKKVHKNSECWKQHPEKMPSKFKKNQKDKDKKDEDKKPKEDKPSSNQANANSAFSFLAQKDPLPYVESKALSARMPQVKKQLHFDSGATDHMTPFKGRYIEYNDLEHPKMVYTASGDSMEATGIGKV